MPRNSPAYVAAIADAVADAEKIVERIEREKHHAEQVIGGHEVATDDSEPALLAHLFLVRS